MPLVRGHDADIHYTVQGRGPAVILGHSFLCSGGMWAGQLDALAERYRVVNVDLRGHGQSGPLDCSCTLYDMVDDMLAVLDDAAVEQATWVGLSIGGMIALRAALQAPDRVMALVLIDTDGGAESPWTRLQYALLGATAAVTGLGPLLPEVTRRMFSPTAMREQPALVAEWRRRFKSVHVPSALRVLRALRTRDDLGARLGGIDRPALVVVGEEDRSLPPERSVALATALPRARLLRLPATGHLSAVERPAEVSRAIRDFLDSL